MFGRTASSISSAAGSSPSLKGTPKNSKRNLKKVEQAKNKHRDHIVNTLNSNPTHDPGIAGKVRHHLHHQPKAHEKRFSWLEYQFDRKVSAMNGRQTGLPGGGELSHDFHAKPGASWEDLNQQPDISFWKQKWSWQNIVYKYEELSKSWSNWWYQMIGLQVNDINIKLYGSHKGVYLQNLNLTRAHKKYNKIIIHPYSNLRLVWDIGMIFLLFVQVIVVPTNVAFSSKPFHRNSEYLYLLDYLTDLIFLLDIGLSFKTAYLMDKTEVVLDPDQIKSNYLRGWFLLDLPSTLPIDVIFNIVMKATLSIQTNFTDADSAATMIRVMSNNNAMKLLKGGKIVKVLKILRINRIIRYMSMFEQLFQDSYDVLTFCLSFAKYIFILFTVLHMEACVIWWIPTYDHCSKCMRDYYTNPETKEQSPSMACEFPPWSVKQGLLDKFTEDPVKHFWECYWFSLFKAMSNMLCIGYGLEPSPNQCDMLVTLFTLSAGALVFGFLIGAIVTTNQQLNMSERIYNNKYRHVTEYMRFRGLPNELRERIYMYYEYRFQGKVFDENAILDELNPVMRKVVRHYNQMWLISSAPIFEDCSQEFKDKICESLVFELYLPDDELFKEGDRATAIYFISRGRVRIEVNDEVLGRKLDGETCGELCMIFPDHERVCTAVCETCTHVYQLELSKFLETAGDYKRDYLEVLRYARYRIEDEESYYNNEAQHRESMNRFIGQGRASRVSKFGMNSYK